jgi:hypothetical protein
LASKIQFQGVLIDVDKKTLLYSAIYHQEFEVWTPRLIQRAFASTSLFPFNPN